MKNVFFFFFIIACYASMGQYNMKGLTDTVNFVLQQFDHLNSIHVDQECYRLNFEDCNLEVTQEDLEGNWRVFAFWNYDIDQDKTLIKFHSSAREWSMTITTIDSLKTFKMSTNGRSGFTNIIRFYSDKEEKLQDLKNALHYAATRCKGLDRFKNR